MTKQLAKMPSGVVSDRGMEARILSQLLASLALVHVFPSERKIAEFTCEALKSVPGLTACSVCLRSLSEPVGDVEREKCLNCEEFKDDTGDFVHYSCPLIEQTGISMIPLETSERFYGLLLLQVGQADVFEPYEPFMKNFANSIAITVENRWQRKRLETANTELRLHGDHLEGLVEERTAALNETNEQLHNEISERKRDMEALRRSEESFRNLVESAPYSVVAVKSEGNIMLVNSQTEKIFGYGRGELLGKPLEILIPSRFREKHLNHRAGFFVEPRLRRMGGGLGLKGRRKDGSEFPVDIMLSPLETEDGTIVMSMIQDITERKQVEEALQESEKFFSGTLNDMLTFVAVLEPDGKVIFVNNTPLKLAGITLDDVKGMMFYDAFWWQYSEEARQQVMADIVSCASGATLAHDIEIQTAERGLIWIEFSMHPIYDKDGKIKYLVPEGRDITEHKLAEKAKQESEQKYSELFRQAPDAILTLDKKGTVTAINPAGEQLTGLSSNDIVGKNFPENGILSKEAIPKAVKMLANIVNGKKPSPSEWNFLHVDGSRIPVEANPQIIRRDGKGHGVQVILRDITKRKQVEEELEAYRDRLEVLVKKRTGELEEKTIQLEETNIWLQEADRHKTIFLASMSHELRTPLNSIIGFTGIILQGIVGEITQEQRKQLTMVKNSANHLLELINDLLDISKIEAGKVELSRQEFSIADVIMDVVAVVSPLANERGLELLTAVPGSIMVHSDRRRVRQILMNLMSNAIKFTEHGSVKIATRKLRNKKLAISVTDTGIGIKEDDLIHLFAPFEQIDMSLTKRYEGTGLGLYLTKKLVSLLEGEISVKSEYGRGSEFTFVLAIK